MRVRRRIALVASCVVAIVATTAVAAGAHPLGNFTVNVSAALTVRSDEVAIEYVVDMAEIPAFRERRAIDTDADGSIDASEATDRATLTCASLARGLEIRSDDRSVSVTPRGRPSLTFPAGAGGLATLRLDCAFTGSLAEPIRTGSTTAISFVDRNHADAIGWREVSAGVEGVTLVRSDVPARSTTAALKSYPRDVLPLDVRAASLTVAGGSAPLDTAMTTDAAGSSSESAADRGGLIFSLVGRPDLSPMLVIVMLVVAIGVGALHALGPGHGKTLIGAYLVGAGGTIRHAVGVGAAVSLMHTASVLVLSAIVLAAERIATPERLYAWLGVAAGVLAVGLGGAVLASRIRSLRSDARDRHDADHEHHRTHPHGAITRSGLVALALSGGALPSPTALLVFLGAVSVGRAVLGLTMIAAFSVGLAGTLIGVGIVMLRAHHLAQARLSARVLRSVPIVSASVIVAMGIFVAARGAAQL